MALLVKFCFRMVIPFSNGDSVKFHSSVESCDCEKSVYDMTVSTRQESAVLYGYLTHVAN